MRTRFHQGMLEHWNHEIISCPVCGNHKHLSWNTSPNFDKIGDIQYGKLQIECFACTRGTQPTRRDMETSYPGLNACMLEKGGYTTRTDREPIRLDLITHLYRKPHPVFIKKKDGIKVNRGKKPDDRGQDIILIGSGAAIPDGTELKKPPIKETPEKQPVKTPEKPVEPPPNKTLWQRIVEFVKNIFKKL